jgi:hypothetical protein
VGFDYFRIGSIDRGAGDDDGCADHVSCRVALIDGCAELCQPISDRAALEIGAGDLHAQTEQNLRNSAHTDAADADEVRVLGDSEHGDEIPM